MLLPENKPGYVEISESLHELPQAGHYSPAGGSFEVKMAKRVYKVPVT